MPKSGVSHRDYIPSAIIGDHYIKDAIRAAAGIGVLRPNMLIGIVTATKRANVVRRAVIHALSTKTLTLKGDDSSKKFKVGDPVYSIQYVTTEYESGDSTPKEFSLTEKKVSDLGTVASVDHDENKITFSGTAPTPALAEHDIVYVADGSEKAVGMVVNEVDTDNNTWDDNVSYIFHGYVNKNLVPNYDGIADQDLEHIVFVEKEVE